MKNFDRLFSKNTFIILTVFMFSTVFLYNSCQKSIHQDDYITQSDIDSLKKNHIIPLKGAKDMHKKYSKDRVRILKDTLKEKYKNKDFKDTRMVWFDIKTIETYIKYVKEESDKVGIDPEGLQFYFGVNSDKDSGKKKNHQTFFVAPTTKNVMNGDTIQSGYTLEKGKQIFLYEAFKKYAGESEVDVQKASFFNLMQDDDGLLLNHGSGTPPGGNN